MISPAPVPKSQTRTWLRNTLALAIMASGAAGLYVQFQPEPVRTGSGGAAADVATLSAELEESQPVSVDSPGGTAPGELPDGPARPLEGRAALEHDLERLYFARDRLQRIPGYTATFSRRERTGRNLGDLDVMHLKVRHEPFAFYMRWLNGDEGREILLVEGQNDGEMLVNLGGLRGRLLPALNIDPNGATARRECRHPATEVGLLHLTQRMIRYRERDLRQSGRIVCQMQPNCEFQGRLCDKVVIEYSGAELSPDYRKTMHYLDRELGVPVLVKSYGWIEDVADADPDNLDETTLVEQYAYTDVRLNAGLADRDFDRDNPRYAFSR